MATKKHDCVPIIIEDFVELKLPPSGLVALEPETGEIIFVNSSSKNLQKPIKTSGSPKKL